MEPPTEMTFARYEGNQTELRPSFPEAKNMQHPNPPLPLRAALLIALVKVELAVPPVQLLLSTSRPITLAVSNALLICITEEEPTKLKILIAINLHSGATPAMPAELFINAPTRPAVHVP